MCSEEKQPIIDFEDFEPKSFVKRLLGFGDIGKLFSIVKDVISKED